MKEEEKFLAGMLARASKSDELVFLHDNDDYIMQENYAEFYADSIRKYQKSTHIFDEETTVQDIVKKQIAQGQNMEDNFKFEKSETDIFVQLLLRLLNIVTIFNSRSNNYSGMKIFCNIMGGCLSIPDEKYIERYKREFEEHGNDIFITEQIDINMEFAIIIVLLKCISSKAMIDKICSGKKSERDFTKLRYEACKSDMMICELEEGCYGSVLDQVEYLEKAMPYFLKKDILNRKNLAIKEMIIAREKRKRENMQQTISVVAFVITFFGGLPYVKDTLKIIYDVIPSRFIHIPCEYINSISVFIWLFFTCSLYYKNSKN